MFGGTSVLKRSLFAGAALAALLVPLEAKAQRAGENAVTSAEDAFGVSIGDQNVGLYSDNSARGFSPQQAGNIRLDGLYFDQQFQLQGRIDTGTTMRVGLSAQSYPFPAPTGIADVALRRPGAELAGSLSLQYGPYGNAQIEADISTPIIAGKLGAIASLAGSRNKYDWRAEYDNVVSSAALNWTPSDRVDVVAFFHSLNGIDGEGQPFMFTAGPFTPPKYDRSVYFGQEWAARNRVARNFGAVILTEPGDGWRLRAGLFRSTNELLDEYIIFFRNVQQDGTALLDITRSQPQFAGSTSGEVRASKVFVEGDRQHTFHFAVKGRDVLREFGGSDTKSFGPARIGVVSPVPAPVYNLTATSRDDVFQVTPGVSYVGQWRNVGEFSAGIQKSVYNRNVNQPGLPEAQTRDRPWLYNATLAITATPALAFYAGYTRGLEESGIAPENALNRGEALPASLTEQMDAGLRYRISPRMSLIAGVFEVKKPFFERDATNLFTDVGNVSHRGAEFSFSGQPVQGLNVVAGVMLLRARIEGNQATAGVIGPVPVARPNRNVRVNVQYGPKEWNGFSLTGAVVQDGPVYANRANTLRLKAVTTLDLGMRYNFTLYGEAASARLQVFNVTNEWAWTVLSSGAFAPNKARRVQINLVSDF
jgi:iron complex outermembrane receptor protein